MWRYFTKHQTVRYLDSELDIFSVPPTVTSIESGQWGEHQPTASLDSGGTIEFLLPGSGDVYMDLAYLFVRAKVTKPDGSNLDTDNPVGPVNNGFHSLFTQVDVYLNDTLVTPSTNTCPYRAYIETALSYGSDATETQLTSQLWYKNTAGRTDSVALADDDTANAGFKSRRGHVLTRSGPTERGRRQDLACAKQGCFRVDGGWR